jgi:hypothetical protein
MVGWWPPGADIGRDEGFELLASLGSRISLTRLVNISSGSGWGDWKVGYCVLELFRGIMNRHSARANIHLSILMAPFWFGIFPSTT